MKRIIKMFFLVALVFSVVSHSAVAYYGIVLGDNYYVRVGETPDIYDSKVIEYKVKSLDSALVAKNGSNLNSYDLNVSLFGIIPVKTVHITEAQNTEVVVLGNPFGIKIYTEGVMVVGFIDVCTHNGDVNPALNAGLMIGDMILEINGLRIREKNDVQAAILSCEGKSLKIKVNRNGKVFSVNVNPAQSSTDGKWKAGMWVRDSSAGIGTLTFYNPSTDVLAGLGHGICDPDTDKLLPLESGEFVEAEIVGLEKSTKDDAGELQGIFSGGEVANIKCNDITGVYGTDCDSEFEGKLMQVALRQEIKVGKATVITTIDDEGPKEYECEIEKIYFNDGSKIKNMIVKITDKELLAKTGGIVQGMSGSPIIQNGKLIGAVTHVLVEDCSRGYAIFAENMLETAQSVVDSLQKKAG